MTDTLHCPRCGQSMPPAGPCYCGATPVRQEHALRHSIDAAAGRTLAATVSMLTDSPENKHPGYDILRAALRRYERAIKP